MATWMVFVGKVNRKSLFGSYEISKIHKLNSYWILSFVCRNLELGDTDLGRKISLCNELLGVAEILEPGNSLFRGRLLIDLQEALSHQTERQLQDKTISAVTAQV